MRDAVNNNSKLLFDNCRDEANMYLHLIEAELYGFLLASINAQRD